MQRRPSMISGRMIETCAVTATETTRSNGSKSDVFGSDPNCMMIFAGDDHFVQVLTRSGLHARDDDNPDVKFSSARRKFHDTIRAAQTCFLRPSNISTAAGQSTDLRQARVDGFQGFRKLEVSLIDLLVWKSPTCLQAMTIRGCMI